MSSEEINRRDFTRALAGAGLAAVEVQSASAQGNANAPYKNANLTIPERVADLLSRMALEEKVEQISGGFHFRGVVDPTGQFTDQNYLHALAQSLADKERRDAEPRPLDLVALDRVAQHRAVARGHDMRIDLAHLGVKQLFAPVVHIGREPRWGRVGESFGEDPYLISRFGVAAVRGFQGEQYMIGPHHTLATLKHFVGYGEPEGGRNDAPRDCAERVLREAFFPGYKAPVQEAHVASVMAATRPVKELRGFERVTLKPGETRTVKFRLGPQD